MALISTTTKYGRVKGVALDGGCTVFRGIKYAKAKRFMPPDRPDSWEGEKVCDTFSPICPQNQNVPGMPFSDFFIKEFYPKHQPMSEDMLSDIVTGYWANFAKNGDPNGEGLPLWPAYDRTDPDHPYATCVMDENSVEAKPLIDDNVWALAAFKMFG